MIENIELHKETKIHLQHLSINKGVTLNVLMSKGAQYVLEHAIPIKETEKGIKYTTYTMRVDEELKQDIRNRVQMENAKLRDFWATVSEIILQREGEF